MCKPKTGFTRTLDKTMPEMVPNEHLLGVPYKVHRNVDLFAPSPCTWLNGGSFQTILGPEWPKNEQHGGRDAACTARAQNKSNVY